jgi:hypothetical protein
VGRAHIKRRNGLLRKSGDRKTGKQLFLGGVWTGKVETALSKNMTELPGTAKTCGGKNFF